MTTVCLTALAATTSALAVVGPSVATSTSTPASSSDATVPAAGATVRCQGVGRLTATGGHLVRHEPTWHDGHARAHTLFTIIAREVRLIDKDGTRYRLLGGGYDAVVYPGRSSTGPVSSEHEVFTFDVTGPDGVVGVVRFRLQQTAGHSPRIHDGSTCRLPQMS